MGSFTFHIPEALRDLSKPGENFCISSPYQIKDLPMHLKEAKRAFKSDGDEGDINFILEEDHFTVYYSVLCHIESLSTDVTFQAYLDLQDVIEKLATELSLILEDRASLTAESKKKYLNILQMLVYFFSEIVKHFSDISAGNHSPSNRKKKNKSKAYAIDESRALLALGNLINLNISSLWNPPIVEEEFTLAIAGVCFSFLLNPSIKNDEALLTDLFDVLGNLLKNYNFSSTLCLRLVDAIKKWDHVGSVAPEGVKLMVERYKCPGLVKQLIKETTEWQRFGLTHDAKGERICNNFVIELAALFPEIVCEQIDTLADYIDIAAVPLRSAVITIFCDLLGRHLRKTELSEDERRQRDELFEHVLEHLHDHSAVVRTVVIQNVTKLQTLQAIPINLQDDVLFKVIQHLRDVTSSVRKAAVECVKAFLAYNPYGARLQQSKIEEKQAILTNKLNKLEADYHPEKVAVRRKIDSEWAELLPSLEKAIADYNKDQDEELDEEQIPPPELFNVIQTLFKEKKYDQVVALCKRTRALDMRKFMEPGLDENHLFLFSLREIYNNLPEKRNELEIRWGPSPKERAEVEELEKEINFHSKCVSFLKVLETSIQPMKEMLLSTLITDVKGAIEFFIAAYQFQIDGAQEGILVMLRLMRVNEQDRKDAVSKAFCKIYLTTDAKTVPGHTTEVVERLIQLLQETSVDDIPYLEAIVSQWAVTRVVSNDVIDRCWAYVMRKGGATGAESRGACEILRMAALGRPSIARSNVQTVGAVAFGDYASTDLLFVRSACRLMMVGRDSSDKRIPHTHETFDRMVALLGDKFFEPCPYFPSVLESAIEMVYALCKKPNAVSEMLSKKVLTKIAGKSKWSDQVLINLCSFLAALALQMMNYGTDTIYPLLKERRETEKKKNKRKRKSQHNSSTPSVGDMTVLEGAEAYDEDHEYVMEILDKEIVCGSGPLAQFGEKIVRYASDHNNNRVQGNALKAYMRFMLVSRTFCVRHIRRLFDILAATKFPEVKSLIVVHCSDLLTKFPNVIEPFTPMIFGRLRDESEEVRRITLFTLGNLIMKDMLRAHQHISELALCLTDPSREVSSMCLDFFKEFSRKDNYLSNFLPEIFTYLDQNPNINDEKLEFTMSSLFSCIHTSQRMEHLVDRFCDKYRNSDDLAHQKRVTYCLSLVLYNEKALRKLQAKFPVYRDLLKERQIYEVFAKILAACSKVVAGKVPLKPIVSEIEALFATVDRDISTPHSTPQAIKGKKRRRGTRGKKDPRKKQKQASSGSESA